MDYREQLENQRAHLARVNQRIAEYEQAAARAKGRPSESFAHNLAEARKERDLLAKHIAELSREDALSWTDSDAQGGVLRICDEIGKRIARSFRVLDKPET